MSFRRRKLLHWGVRIDPEAQRRRLQCPCGAAKKPDHFICHACWVAAPAKLKNDYRLIRDSAVIRALREFAASRKVGTSSTSSPTFSGLVRDAVERIPTDPAPQHAALPACDSHVVSNSSGRESTQRAARPDLISTGTGRAELPLCRDEKAAQQHRPTEKEEKR